MLLVWFYEALLFWFYEALLLYYYGPVYLCLVINEVVHAVVLPVIVQQMASIDLRRKWEVVSSYYVILYSYYRTTSYLGC